LFFFSSSFVESKAVRQFNRTIHFHEDCHICVVCNKKVKSGERFTVEKEGTKCFSCWEHWHAQKRTLPQGGGAKPSEDRGYVWQQVQLINSANPEQQIPQGKEKKGGGVREGNMGTCAVCRKTIFGVLLRLGEKDLHPECHRCGKCKRQFAEDETFAREGYSKIAICNQCIDLNHQNKIASKPQVESEIQTLDKTSMGKCGSCSKDVYDSAVTVQSAKYHKTCFKCDKCGNQINPKDGFVREGAGFWCENCC
jgi:hypothetical protein